MNLRSCILTNNRCYKTKRTITPQGVMVHSTGANNPFLKRYVQPDDGKLGDNPNNNDWNRSDLSVCVHAFIGKLQDGSVATYQTLPWNHRGWHSGSGRKGSANNTHISFEICEDGLEDKQYFNAVYKEAVELTAYLCKLYKLDPTADGVVICHSEGYKRGIASNHGDVMHWFPKHGKDMDDFRADVKKEMEGDDMTKDEVIKIIEEYEAQRAKAPVSSWAKVSWEKAKKKGVLDGTKPKSCANREQIAVILDRLGLL